MMPPKMVPRALVSLGMRMTRIAGCGAAVTWLCGLVGSLTRSTPRSLPLSGAPVSVNRHAAREAFLVAVEVGDRLLRVAPAEVAVAVVPVDEPEALDLAAESDDALAPLLDDLLHGSLELGLARPRPRPAAPRPADR